MLETGSGHAGRRYVDGSIRLDDLARGAGVGLPDLRLALAACGTRGPLRVCGAGAVAAPGVSQEWVRRPVVRGPPVVTVQSRRGPPRDASARRRR